MALPVGIHVSSELQRADNWLTTIPRRDEPQSVARWKFQCAYGRLPRYDLAISPNVLMENPSRSSVRNRSQSTSLHDLAIFPAVISWRMRGSKPPACQPTDRSVVRNPRTSTNVPEQKEKAIGSLMFPVCLQGQYWWTPAHINCRVQMGSGVYVCGMANCSTRLSFNLPYGRTTFHRKKIKDKVKTHKPIWQSQPPGSKGFIKANTSLRGKLNLSRSQNKVCSHAYNACSQLSRLHRMYHFQHTDIVFRSEPIV